MRRELATAVAAGESVSLSCRVDGGVSDLLNARSERYEVGADGSVSVYLHGTVDAKTDTSVGPRKPRSSGYVLGADGYGPELFGVGTTVKIHCESLAARSGVCT